MADAPVSLSATGPWICRADMLPVTYAAHARWHDVLYELVATHRAWARLGRNADGLVAVFDTSRESLFRCAGWSEEVKCLVPDWT